MECPQCGKKAKYFGRMGYYSGKGGSYQLCQCDKCGIETCLSGKYSGMIRTEFEERKDPTGWKASSKVIKTLNKYR